MKNKKAFLVIKILLIGLFVFFANDSFSQKTFPNIDLKLIDGSELKRDSLENNILIINLWGTWCGPCIAEIPELNKLVQEYKNKRVKFLALATDDSIKVKSFLLKKEFNFVHLDNSNSKYFDKGFFRSYPRTLVYDKTGKLIKKYTGQLNDENLKNLRELIEK